MSELTTEEKVYLIECFFSRGKIYSNAYRGFRTKFGTHRVASENTLKRIIDNFMEYGTFQDRRHKLPGSSVTTPEKINEDKTVSSPFIAAASGDTAAPGRTPKKATPAKSTKPRVKATHPKTSEMVNSAIKDLKERGGSSLQAIKKYMASTYKIDTEKQATFIRKYLKAAVASGVLVQTKGKGAAGSFKLASTKMDTIKPKAKPAAKAKAPKKASAATKKPTAGTPKKATIKKAATTAISQKRKVSKEPAAKPPKAKSTKAKPAAKAPVKNAKPTAVTKAKPSAAKPKKAAPKKATVAKK